MAGDSPGDEIARDVTASDAFTFLDEALAAGEIDEAKAQYARAKFAELHGAVMKAMENEKVLFQRAKTLKEKSLEEAKQLVALDAGGAEVTASSTIQQLREDADEAENESMICKERETVLQLEVNELMSLRNDHRGTLEMIEREKAEAMAPQIDAIKGDIHELEKEVESLNRTSEVAQNEARDAQLGYGKAVQTIKELTRERTFDRQNFEKVAALPERLRKQGAVVESALNQIKNQGADLTRRLRKVEESQRAVNEKFGQKEHQSVELSHAIGRAQDEIHKMRVKADTLAGDVQDMVHTNMQFEMEKGEIQVQLNAKGHEAGAGRLDLQNRRKACDASINQLKATTAACKSAEASVPEMKQAVEQLAKAQHGIQSNLAKKAKELHHLTSEVEIYVNAYLKKEMDGKGKSLAVQHSSAEVDEYEKEVVSLKKEEGVRDKQVSELSSHVERAARMATAKVTRYKETLEAVRVRDIIISDLKKKKKDTLRRLKDFQQLYDLVKNQRNKFVNLIQASSQSIAEFKEKLKILSNEVGILQSEILAKEKLLTKARLDHSNGQMERDHLRAELNKCALSFRDKQETVDEQIADVDKLNALINATERDMLRLKKQYETHVENRNLTGIMLIDRNDELCILYEKLNIQEKVIREGEMKLNERIDEVWHINLAIKDVARSVEVTKKLLPVVPALDSDVASLQKQLLEARMQSQVLSEELESPDNKSRWRRLPGKIPDKEELNAKINQLQERLNDKKEQLLEKELILEEVSVLSDRLRSQAAEGRADTLQLAKRVNDYQDKLRGITRRMMATVSELSMYQASALKLQAEKGAMEGEVMDAQERLAGGEAPTEEIAVEWERMLRARAMAAEHAAAVQQGQEGGPVGTRTTAEPRPNAYIPEHMGIPKPYGGYAPFKPSEPGSSMRHIRAPAPREIEI
mmetsp:Transcript_45822/g.146119  ORF Transcript_45822/g.146119 Transcript_45822/m.146119 type:complete len:925 (-) Transcript_45822:53-2827(-)